MVAYCNEVVSHFLKLIELYPDSFQAFECFLFPTFCHSKREGHKNSDHS